MQHKEELGPLVALANDFSKRVTHFSNEEKAGLGDWFDRHLQVALAAADKHSSLAVPMDFAPEDLASFLNYLKVSSNLTKCNYKDLCAFSRSLTLLTREQRLMVALVSAALDGQVQVLGKVPEMFLAKNSWCFIQLKDAFPDIQSLLSLSTSSSVSSLSQVEGSQPDSAVKYLAHQKPLSFPSPLPPRHPKVPSYFHHYKQHIASIVENGGTKKGRCKK